MTFNIGNLTGEPIEVKFTICDDLLYEGLKKNITQRRLTLFQEISGSPGPLSRHSPSHL
jgi:hypothetical protein